MNIIEKFLQQEKINNKSEGTIKNHTSFLKKAHKWKPLDEWNKDDINNFISELLPQYKKATVEWDKQVLKTFFTWAEKPKLIEHLKIQTVKNNLKRDEILTTEDITKLIESTDSTLYKALIAFLFESGARIKEALSIKVKDIQETDTDMLISIPQTKGGNDQRRGSYIFSMQYIRNHIAYLDLKQEDRLFKISTVAAWEMFKKIGKKAEITKPVNPHAFRHAHATDMVLRNYNETIIRKQLGWTGDSKMIARYTHIVDEDVINATREKNGSITAKTITTNIKMAEPLKIANASLKLKKLSDENEELKHQHNDTSLQLKKLSEDFETLKNTQEATNLILKMLETGLLKPDEIKAIAALKTSNKIENVEYLLNDSPETSKIMKRVKSIEKIIADNKQES